MDRDLSEELATLVRGLYPTQVLRSADEGGGVKLSFITNNRLYQLRVQTEDQPDEFILSGGAENPYLEAPPAVMQAFVRQMRVRFPSADYGPRGPHGADFGASASGRRSPGSRLQDEFPRCKRVVDLCLDGASGVIRELDGR